MPDIDADSVHTLPALSGRGAALWPDKVVLRYDQTGEALSYAEFEARSNAFAHALASLGIGTGDKVAVMVRNRPEFALTWFALSKLGAAMVPVNVNYRESDAGYVLGQSESRLVVAGNEFRGLLEGLEGADRRPVIAAEDDGPRSLPGLAATMPTSAPAGEVAPDRLVNLQYTSGTTGFPKGCMLPQGFFLALARLMAGPPVGFGTDDVMITPQAFYYLDPQWMLVNTMLVGAELVVLDDFHPSSFWDQARAYGATIFYCIASMSTLLHKMPASDADRDHRVRLVMCSELPADIHRDVEVRWGVPWFEMYGMTEIGAATIVWLEDHDELVGSGCIGSAIRDREIKVVDDSGAEVAAGETGELLVRGPWMMQGYYRNAEATREAFEGDWFRSSDVVRIDDRKRIYFVSRTKDMIRRGGENIAAREVEETIESHPLVLGAACVPVPDEIWGEEVKAYVMLTEGADPGAAAPQALATWCRDRLARFKVPRYWSFVADFPRTPSERVAKKQLTGDETDLRRGAYDNVDGIWR